MCTALIVHHVELPHSSKFQEIKKMKTADLEHVTIIGFFKYQNIKNKDGFITQHLLTSNELFVKLLINCIHEILCKEKVFLQLFLR